MQCLETSYVKTLSVNIVNIFFPKKARSQHQHMLTKTVVLQINECSLCVNTSTIALNLEKLNPFGFGDCQLDMIHDHFMHADTSCS